MAEIAFILFAIALICFAIALILYIIDHFVSRKSDTVSLGVCTCALVVIILGVISGLTATVFDCIAERQIEYVECEYCGSRVPREEYNP